MFWRKPKIEPEPVLRTPVLELCDVVYPTPCGNAATFRRHGYKTCEEHKPEGAKR